LILAALAASASFGACADALHLDPPSATSLVRGDAGADAPAPMTCRSNPDCAYPTPVCDTIAQVCVECLVILDCVEMPGTVCSRGHCSCPSDAGTALSYCAGETPACVDTTTAADNCGSCGNVCLGACTAGKCENGWSATATVGVPEARSHHIAVWTGTQMFVWGGRDGFTALNSGGLYDPATKTWMPTSMTNAPAPRYDATAVWDSVDKVVLVWGGAASGTMFHQDGGRYDPMKDAWSPITTAGAPSGRVGHSAVWTGKGMIVWGGMATGNPPYLGDGAVYDPTQDMWVTTIATAGAPSARANHSGVWDSALSRMVVFGGQGGATLVSMALGDAFAYDPMGNAWSGIAVGGPSKRYGHTAVWDQSMSTLVWGGYDGATYLQDGDSLNGMTWSPLGSGASTPEGRVGHSAVVLTAAAKSQLVIFGGDLGGSTILDKGWSLDLVGNTWSPLATPGPAPRTHHTAVANGATMFVWGGDTPSGPTNTGAIYAAM
jgi:N-acetylneuraminic acid mutarotase